MSEEARPAELNALEAALAALAPATPAMDRDRLMFHAGQETKRRGRWAWPAVTAAALLLAAIEATFLVIRLPAVEIVSVPTQQTPTPSEAVQPPLASARPLLLADSSYWKLREQVLLQGDD